MKTCESENSTGDRINQLVEIFRGHQDRQMQQSRKNSQGKVQTNENQNHTPNPPANTAHVPEATEDEDALEVEVIEFNGSPITYQQYTNKAYVNDEDELTEFNDLPIPSEVDIDVRPKSRANAREYTRTVHDDQQPSLSTSTQSEPRPSTSTDPTPEPSAPYDITAGPSMPSEPAPAYSPPTLQSLHIPSQDLAQIPGQVLFNDMSSGINPNGNSVLANINETLPPFHRESSSFRREAVVSNEERAGPVTQFWVLFR